MRACTAAASGGTVGSDGPMGAEPPGLDAAAWRIGSHSNECMRARLARSGLDGVLAHPSHQAVVSRLGGARLCRCSAAISSPSRRRGRRCLLDAHLTQESPMRGISGMRSLQRLGSVQHSIVLLKNTRQNMGLAYSPILA